MNTHRFKNPCTTIMAGLLSLLLSLSAMSMVSAAPIPPVVMLEQTSQHLLHALHEHDVAIRKNHDVLYGLVKQILLPRVDQEAMARLVVGRHYWQRATLEQRRAFIHEFTRLVVRTYAVALSSYNQQQVKFLPLRERVANQRRLQVNTLVVKPGAPSIPVTYRLVKRGTVWKIYDFSVDGVSFIHNYRSQFAGVLASGGFSGLLVQLASHNKEA